MRHPCGHGPVRPLRLISSEQCRPFHLPLLWTRPRRVLPGAEGNWVPRLHELSLQNRCRSVPLCWALGSRGVCRPGLPLCLPPAEGALASRDAGFPPPAPLGRPGSSEGLRGLSALEPRLSEPPGWEVGCVSACLPLSRKQRLMEECLRSACNAVGGWRRGSHCF